MNVRSPQEGIITTWEAKKNLMGRPVEIGTELLQIAESGSADRVEDCRACGEAVLVVRVAAFENGCGCASAIRR